MSSDIKKTQPGPASQLAEPSLLDVINQLEYALNSARLQWLEIIQDLKYTRSQMIARVEQYKQNPKNRVALSRPTKLNLSNISPRLIAKKRFEGNIDALKNPPRIQTEASPPLDNLAETEIQPVVESALGPSGCISLLRQVDPILVQPYIGAQDALRGNNPDRARHTLISLRELWNCLLERLAPDNLVHAWISNMPNQKDLLNQQGKPNRQAKALFICREINNGPLTDFPTSDIQALRDLFLLFNRVHKLEINLTDEQLRAIFLKSDSCLMYILRISKGGFFQ